MYIKANHTEWKLLQSKYHFLAMVFRYLEVLT